MKVLVVSDDPNLGSLCELLLKRAGHASVYCKGGGAALTVLIVQSFDAVLIDDHLRGLDGPALAEEAGGNGSDARLLVISNASSPLALRARYRGMKVEAFLEKDSLESDLLGALTAAA